jgi:hypothetical protein
MADDLDKARESMLSDHDVQRIAEELERRLTQRFYLNIGKGFWALAWKGIMLMALAIAAYGAFKGLPK